MNNVSLIGRLTKDPELRTTASGKSISKCRIAINGRGEKPDYVDVISFDASAEAVVANLKKGRQVGVSGRLSYSEWEKDGQKHSKHEVVGQVEFLGSKPTE